jgi:trimeric autotransporter adhesin
LASFVGGGLTNTASGDRSVVVGGNGNIASTNAAAIGGGLTNRAYGFCSSIPGGLGNTATDYGFAAGYGALATNVGAFVWSSQVMTGSTNAYSFTARAPGGVRFITSTNNVGAFLAPNATAWSVLSDCNSKENFVPINEQEILHKLEQMPVTKWNYKHDPTRAYIGPTAQDFKAAFGLGNDDKSINTLDTAGVTLAAIKGMGQELNSLRSQLHERDRQMAERDAKIDQLEKSMQKLAEKLNQLPPSPETH